MKYLLLLPAVAAVLGCGQASPPAQTTNGYLVPFRKVDSLNPVLSSDTSARFFCPMRHEMVQWEAKDVFNPAATVRHDTVFLLYRAEDTLGRFAGTSRVGIAWSTDGLHFHKYPQPVLFPDRDSFSRYEWEGGCEDPRIVEDSSGTYYLTYTSYDGDKARLMVASSSDLFHWTKHGPAFAAAGNGDFVNLWSKSGSIVCRYRDGRPVAEKINGQYWMYWGDTDIFLAQSEDLVHWIPVTLGNEGLLPVFGPRQGKFDSDLVEPGPPAMITEKGILLMYNSRNVAAKGDSSLPEGTYAAAQILMNLSDPARVKARMDHWFIRPDKPYETSGQVNQVCFIEGLVQYRGKWFLYYGTADSRIAVAVCEQEIR